MRRRMEGMPTIILPRRNFTVVHEDALHTGVIDDIHYA